MIESLRLGPLDVWTSGPADDPAAPILVLLHGRGADGRDLVSLGRYLDLPIRVVCPDAPDPWVEGGMGRSWYPTGGDIGAALERDVALLLETLDAMAAHWPEAGIPVLGGFSQGGVLTYELGFRHPDRFAGLIVMSAFMAPTHPARVAGEGLTGVPLAELPPLLVTHGSLDPLIPIARCEDARRVLDANAVDYEYVEDAVDHTISEHHLAALRAFLVDLGAAG